MLNFCIKSVHSFLAFTTKDSNNNNDNTHGTLISGQQTTLQGRCRNILSPVSGLSFITFSDNTHENPTNVVDSAAIKPPPPTITTIAKKDPGGIGFLDEVGGSVDGLMSCTESLGFESSDERRVDDQVMDSIRNEERGLMVGSRKKWRRSGRRDEEVRKFPPPLSSMNRDGKPIFFLRPVRRDGRLELTEVKINRMEVLHASRQDGRLRLDMIRDVVDVEKDEEEETTDDNNNIEKEKVGENFEDVEEEEIVEEVKVEDIVEEDGGGPDTLSYRTKQEKVGEKWVFPVVNGGGDGFRRCHEVVNCRHHHLHHNLHAWGQHCLTIR